MTKWIDRRHHYSYAEARQLAARERAVVVRRIGRGLRLMVAGWLGVGARGQVREDHGVRGERVPPR
ncbi:hypothetical protein [Phreatobacter stygius]|uniref:Uncharacterized protein n=1 Tax=Phreatobacter stygius TaxID=1940610 RepID=A0A4D7AQB8_9HYPH|nr:hypothetical protein [Phreatobacter stygius]QCI63444.1 hypothetical protein E8M01_03835 [Phreatobacter stygius]